MENQGEDYIEKAQTIFTLLNQFRKNPKTLAKKLEVLRAYLDLDTNILAVPNKIQIQMVEGDQVFKEAISYLKSLSPLSPLEWDENLASSAMEHVNDIGPKGLLAYQSSDGTEPEDRISKYGNYTESLGENIDFGPNDAIGVIISLTLDDGEEQRPHRENLFKSDYHKVGIACGPHKTEFQMCVMDFAYDFTPFQANNRFNNQYNKGKNANEINIQMKKEDMLNNSNYAQQGYQNNNMQSPLVKLSLEKDDFKKMNLNKMQSGNENNNYNYNANNNVAKNRNAFDGNQGMKGKGDLFEETINETKGAMSSLKLKEKMVEIITKITYVFENGSTKEVVETKKHIFK